LLALPRPAQQQIDGVSYAAVLKQQGTIQREAFFNYFPHGASVRRDGGVWVRSGDWKLIRWFGVPPGDKSRHELYNLSEDLSETNNRAAAEPDRVQQLDALIDGFLKETGATWPRPNPQFKASLQAAAPAANDAAADPLEGWKARSCTAVAKDGLLSITATGKAGAAFLGHGAGRWTGPGSVAFRLRSAQGGMGKIEWLASGAANSANARSAPYEAAAGSWQTVEVELPAAPIGVLRLYMPADGLTELDWIELRDKKRPAVRWEFKGQLASP
jgi:hypothetical protein